MGLTKDKIPNGLGVFKFPDEKLHIGLYQVIIINFFKYKGHFYEKKGILDGPCFIHFQNNDFYCGEMKKGKFEGPSVFYQKIKDIWLHVEYHSGNKLES